MGIWDKLYPATIDKADLDSMFGSIRTQQQYDMLAQMIGSGILSQADIDRIMKSLEPLTPTEHSELARLQEEHIAKVKNAKLLVFKKLAPEMRQFVLNSLSWGRVLAEINNATADVDPRMQELDAKNSKGKLFTQDSTSFKRWSSQHVGIDPAWFDQAARHIGLPEGITEQDLLQAHLEATLEEEMLNGNKD